MIKIFIVECILKPLKNQFTRCLVFLVWLFWGVKLAYVVGHHQKLVVFLLQAGDPDNSGAISVTGY